MKDNDINILFRNNTGIKDKLSLIEGFVVRLKPFETIYNELTSAPLQKASQNYLIIGQRGSGKTTLLYRLKYAIDDHTELQQQIIPVMLTEELYNVTDLENLWENIADRLDELEEYRGISKQLASYVGKEFYEELVWEAIQQRLITANKKIIVFIENLDILFKKIGVGGQQRFREILITSDRISVIASSTVYFDAVTDDAKPFYDFFKVIELNGLNKQECITLLLKIGEQMGKKERIEGIVSQNPKRIESLRRLTGGVPRIISYMFQIFLDNENGKAIRDLYQLIDNITPLYKSELDQLSPQQQKVVDVIARNWDAIAVKDIVVKTRYESKQVSSILYALEKNKFIESIATRNKNNLYRIKERFINIWYLMRFGRGHEKENVVWLVRFYETWCDKTELAYHINTHMKDLDGNYDVNAAIDMGNMFLACQNVSIDLKYNLYKKTKSVLPRNFIKELKISDQLLYTKINNLVKEKQYDQAFEVLNETKARDEKYYSFLGWYYFRTGAYLQSEEATEKAYNLKPDGKTAFRIGFLNEVHLNNTQKAEQFYKIAVEAQEFAAASRLGDIYYSKRNLEQAYRYHQLAIDNQINRSLLSMARMTMLQGDISVAEDFALKAINSKQEEGYAVLGEIYIRKSQFKKAEITLLRAFRSGFKPAVMDLGFLYLIRKRKNYSLAKQYFEKAIEYGFVEGYYYLGKLYLEKFENETEGLPLLDVSIEKGSALSAHYLGHYFERKGKYDLSDKYFFKAYELGRKSALLCMVWAIFRRKRKEKKEYALALIEEHLEELKAYTNITLTEYAFLLLWNEKVEQSITIFRSGFLLLNDAISEERDEEMEAILSSAIDYLNLLIAKGLHRAALDLFESNEIVDLKVLAKPVYYALMNFMRPIFPKEYLKAGEELADTIREIIDTINEYSRDHL